MVDIKEQKLFDLLTEEKDIVITNNTKNVLVKQIDDLHYSIERTNWSTLNKEGFVFELERCTQKLKGIHGNLSEVNREIVAFLEKDVPDSIFNTPLFITLP